MGKRFVSIWFRDLTTDWFTRRRPLLKNAAFVLAAPDHGRMVITAANPLAQQQGIHKGMTVADARTIISNLEVLEDDPELSSKLLKGLAEWCIRYTPAVSIDLPGGLILDASGCAHLWGGERLYLADIVIRLKNIGYYVRAAMADTLGAAWAKAHFGKDSPIIESGQQTTALLSLPPEALRIDPETIELLHKLGLKRISNFISMPRPALRRRFGQQLLTRLDQALGVEEEIMQPVQAIAPYHERLLCQESIVSATGIEIALRYLLEKICNRLQQEQKGIRKATIRCYRTDGRIEMMEIGANRPSRNVGHLFKLFELKIAGIEPGPGIDLFVFDVNKAEDAPPVQEKLWQKNAGLENTRLSELVDRLRVKYGPDQVQRYVPAEHYWPERSVKPALSLDEELSTVWKTEKPRPLQLLSNPEPIAVTAPIPDYPPMLFRYKGKLHKIIKADGPERIEQEWWLQQGQHRDYYSVEDEDGCRYWLFRSGHYKTDRSYQWFIHGFFA